MTMNDGLKGLKSPAKTEKVDLGKKGGFTIHPGKLHKALGIPAGEKIGQKRISMALNSKSPAIRKMAVSAKGLTHMGK